MYIDTSAFRLDRRRGAITSSLIRAAGRRRRHLQSIAGADSALLLATIEAKLQQLCGTNRPRYWHHYALSNGGWYMSPGAEATYLLALRVPSVERHLDADTAGLVSTAMAFTDLAFSLPGVHFSNAYLLLSRFIHQHSRCVDMRAILDEAPA